MPYKRLEFEEIWNCRRAIGPVAYLQIHAIAFQDIIKHKISRAIEHARLIHSILVFTKLHKHVEQIDN